MSAKTRSILRMRIRAVRGMSKAERAVAWKLIRAEHKVAPGSQVMHHRLKDERWAKAAGARKAERQSRAGTP